MEARIQNRAIQFQGPFSLTLLVEALLITYCFSQKGETSDAWEKLPRGEQSVPGTGCGYLEALSVESEGFRE